MRKTAWKTWMAIAAITIVIGTFFYSDYLADNISKREAKRMQEWATAQQHIASSDIGQDLSLASIITAEQSSIPVIETNEHDSIMSYLNLDSSAAQQDPQYLVTKLQEYKATGRSIKTYFGADLSQFNIYYYGESTLLKQVRYFPLVQLLVVVLFVSTILRLIQVRNRSMQNQLWAGLAKETAHQLGTPISALSGWTALLRENAEVNKILPEMDKDIARLKLISERFSMIGGTPKKESVEIRELVEHAVDYIRKRAPEKVIFVIRNTPSNAIQVCIAPTLIEWVIENILKNALDALEGSGNIFIDVTEEHTWVHIDISDDGKGIETELQGEIFEPGVSTKKRGWGLGLTLAKRIIEQYHSGKLMLMQSAPGKGSCFRISLNK
ncbi:MAG: HAMP domain-containing histidine kinase [Bacteroidetes bacterium]|nr:HAMP domain-containing histidine kinase [Bacteroidota bacterium]